VRDTVYPIGVHLATLFGFQMTQAASPAPSAADASTAATAADAHSVPSSLDNQVDHLSKLIKNTMDRLDSRTGYLPAFQAAVGHVHGQVLGNYTNPYPNPNPNPNPNTNTNINTNTNPNPSTNPNPNPNPNPNQVLGNYTRWSEHVGLSGAHLPAAIP